MRLLITALAFLLSLSCNSQQENNLDWTSYDYVVYIPANYIVTQSTQSITNTSFVINDLFDTDHFIRESFSENLESSGAAKLVVLDSSDKIEWLRNKRTSVCFLVLNIEFIL